MAPRSPAKAKRATEAARHPGGRPPKAAAARLSTQLGVRCDPATTARLDRITKKLEALGVSRAAIARRALALGLELVEADPSKLFGEDFEGP